MRPPKKRWSDLARRQKRVVIAGGLFFGPIAYFVFGRKRR